MISFSNGLCLHYGRKEYPLGPSPTSILPSNLSNLLYYLWLKVYESSDRLLSIQSFNDFGFAPAFLPTNSHAIEGGSH